MQRKGAAFLCLAAAVWVNCCSVTHASGQTDLSADLESELSRFRDSQPVAVEKALSARKYHPSYGISAFSQILINFNSTIFFILLLLSLANTLALFVWRKFLSWGSPCTITWLTCQIIKVLFHFMPLDYVLDNALGLQKNSQGICHGTAVRKRRSKSDKAGPTVLHFAGAKAKSKKAIAVLVARHRVKHLSPPCNRISNISLPTLARSVNDAVPDEQAYHSMVKAAEKILCARASQSCSELSVVIDGVTDSTLRIAEEILVRVAVVRLSPRPPLCVPYFIKYMIWDVLASASLCSELRKDMHTTSCEKTCIQQRLTGYAHTCHTRIHYCRLRLHAKSTKRLSSAFDLGILQSLFVLPCNWVRMHQKAWWCTCLVTHVRTCTHIRTYTRISLFLWRGESCTSIHVTYNTCHLWYTIDVCIRTCTCMWVIHMCVHICMHISSSSSCQQASTASFEILYVMPCS